jgi:hypothetical protein
MVEGLVVISPVTSEKYKRMIFHTYTKQANIEYTRIKMKLRGLVELVQCYYCFSAS